MIFASGSCGLVQSSFDPFFFRFRSNRASSARVGVAMPDASASRVSHASYASPVSRRTMLRLAALASSVSTSISRRVRDRVEWSGGASCSAKSRNCRMLSESAARYAMARSESKPSK